MPGKKDRYIYQLFKDGKKVDEGPVSYIAGKYYTGPQNVYSCWKKGIKFVREYDITRIYNSWKPVHNEQYWYCTKNGVYSGYFDEEDFSHLSKFYIKNCFKTKEEAQKNYDRIASVLKSMYKNS